MFHARPTIARPKIEPVSAAMQHAGLWKLYTDGTESQAELIISADAGLDELATCIDAAIAEGWPLLLVLPQINDQTGWKCRTNVAL